MLLSILLFISLTFASCSGRQPATGVSAPSSEVQRVEIAVDQGYEPAVIELQEGRPAELVFELKNPSECLEEVVLDDFNIRKKLVVGEKVAIRLDGLKKGTYDFHCGMNMVTGKIVVR